MKTVKLLVNDVDGFQKILSIDESGSYWDLSRVLWDERIDGKFPPQHEIHIGGLSRAGTNLVFSSVAQNDQNQRKAARQQAKEAKDISWQAASDRLNNLNLTKAFSAKELEDAVKDIVTFIRRG